jgi:hypothetical protein
MTRDIRNLLLVAVVAALCFGGSFVCTSSSDDGDVHGHVIVNPKDQ